MNKPQLSKEMEKRFIDRCIAFGREWANHYAEPRGWSKETLLQELEALFATALEKEREKLITRLMVWTYTQTLSREQLQHKGCGNHNGNNECCRNETLELVRTKLNQLKGNHD